MGVIPHSDTAKQALLSADTILIVKCYLVCATSILGQTISYLNWFNWCRNWTRLFALTLSQPMNLVTNWWSKASGLGSVQFIQVQFIQVQFI